VLAVALKCSQANVSFYERGKQTMPPHVARLLIDYARRFGLTLTFDHVYGNAPLPKLYKRKPAAMPAGQPVPEQTVLPLPASSVSGISEGGA